MTMAKAKRGCVLTNVRREIVDEKGVKYVCGHGVAGIEFLRRHGSWVTSLEIVAVNYHSLRYRRAR
jgi:hypothetical protein